MKKTAIDLIKEEREKQITKYGYTTTHDRNYPNGTVLRGALAYLNAAIYSSSVGEEDWPFDKNYFNSEGELKDLVKAAAMIVAEIDKKLEES